MCSKYSILILISQCDYSSKEISRTAVLKFQMFISLTFLGKNTSLKPNHSMPWGYTEP